MIERPRIRLGMHDSLRSIARIDDAYVRLRRVLFFMEQGAFAPSLEFERV
jgi:hypothetical protein